MKSLLAAVFSLTLLVVRPTIAQDQPQAAPTSDPDALTIAATSAQVLGVQSPPVSVLARGKVAYANSKEEASFELTVVSPRVFKTVAQRANGDAVYVSNHSDGYLSLGGRRHGLGYVNQFGARCPFLPAFSFLAELNAPELVVNRVTTKAGEPFRIKASYKDPDDPEMAEISAAELELEPNTLLPVKLKTVVRPPSNQQIQIPVEYRYENYQKVGQYLLPGVVRILAEGKPHSVVTFDTFELNPPVNPADFEVK